VSGVPLESSARWRSGEATGELIACDQIVEVHVFVHRGRVAWGTSSRNSRVLPDYLHSVCGIEEDALREVVAECRRTGSRFGETGGRLGLVTARS